MKKKNKLVTHNGSFHADDVFACATLCLVLEKRGEKYEIIRTRDPKEIEKGDYVFDIGGVYEPGKNRFDHHQPGGAGKRENGIEYSSFGLVWKHLGLCVCENKEVLEIIDDKLVAPIDAFDNGFDLVENKHKITPYCIQHFFFALRPSLHETRVDNYEMFLESVRIAKEILEREIVHVKDAIFSEKIIEEVYKKTEKVLKIEKIFRKNGLDYAMRIYRKLQGLKRQCFVIKGFFLQ